MCCIRFLQKSTGLKYTGQIHMLRAFDDFCKGYKIDGKNFPIEIAQAWSQSRNNESETYRSARILVMRQFVEFLGQNGV